MTQVFLFQINLGLKYHLITTLPFKNLFSTNKLKTGRNTKSSLESTLLQKLQHLCI